MCIHLRAKLFRVMHVTVALLIFAESVNAP